MFRKKLVKRGEKRYIQKENNAGEDDTERHKKRETKRGMLTRRPIPI